MLSPARLLILCADLRTSYHVYQTMESCKLKLATHRDDHPMYMPTTSRFQGSLLAVKIHSAEEASPLIFCADDVPLRLIERSVHMI